MFERLVASIIAASALTIPGSTGPAHADVVPLPAYEVVAGAVLTPVPPRWVVPVRGYRLTGRFGESSGHWRSRHTGLDFAAAAGTPVRSVGTGVVTATGYDGRYGLVTVVRLGDGTEIWYCHQQSVSVEVGDRVRAGERIGSVGSTGNVTGPHLHLEVRPRPDHPVDPVAWLRARGVRL